MSVHSTDIGAALDDLIVAVVNGFATRPRKDLRVPCAQKEQVPRERRRIITVDSCVVAPFAVAFELVVIGRLVGVVGLEGGVGVVRDQRAADHGVAKSRLVGKCDGLWKRPCDGGFRTSGDLGGAIEFERERGRELGGRPLELKQDRTDGLVLPACEDLGE